MQNMVIPCCEWLRIHVFPHGNPHQETGCIDSFGDSLRRGWMKGSVVFVRLSDLWFNADCLLFRGSVLALYYVP